MYSLVKRCLELKYDACIPEEAMAGIYKAAYVLLHVRKSNWAMLGLYCNTLGFSIEKIEAKYCELRGVIMPK